jgi:hypothetical protein
VIYINVRSKMPVLGEIKGDLYLTTKGCTEVSPIKAPF